MTEEKKRGKKKVESVTKTQLINNRKNDKEKEVKEKKKKELF